MRFLGIGAGEGNRTLVTGIMVLSGAKFTRGKRYLMNVTVSSVNGKQLPGESKSTSISWVTDYWMG
jgi:hypothetical protein